MNCNEFRTEVHEYFRDGLPDARKQAVESHARSCTGCGEFFSTCQELTCKEFVDFLHAYIDHTLPEERTVVFDRHVSICADCTAYLETYKKTMGLSVAAMSEVTASLPKKVPEELVRAILDARRSPPR